MRILLFVTALPLGIFGALYGDLFSMLGASLLVFLSLIGVEKFEFAPLEHTPVWGVLVCASGILSIMATWLSRRAPEDLFAGIIWGLALLSLLVAGWMHDHTVVGEANPINDKKPAWSWGEVVAVALFTCIAFALRIYQIDILPPLHGDEGEMGDLAVHILTGESPPPLFVTGWLDHPTLFHYLQASSIWLSRWFVDQDIIGLRLISSLFGALCVPAIYHLARQGWGQMAALTAAWLLTTSHLHIHYSRIGLNNIQSVWATIFFLALLAMAAKAIIPPDIAVKTKKEAQDGESQDEEIQEDKHTLPDSLATQQPLHVPLYMPFIGAGLLAGIAQYFYFGSRLMPVLLIPLLAYLWWRRAANIPQIILLVVSFFVAYLPIIPHFLQTPITFGSRSIGVSVFSEQNMQHLLGAEASWPQDVVALLWFQLERNLRFFVDFGDVSAFYYADIPGFDAVTVFLFWLGLGIALTKALRYHEFSVLLWFGSGVILAGVLTNDSPNGPRMIVMASSVFVIAGIFTQTIYNLFRAAHPRIRYPLFTLMLLAIIGSTAWLNFNMYFVTYAKAPPRTLPFAIAQEMMVAPTEYDTFLMGEPNLYAEYGTFRFLAHDAAPRNLVTADELQTHEREKPGLLVIMLAHKRDQLLGLQERFPDGVVEHHEDSLGRFLFTSYRVEP